MIGFMIYFSISDAAQVMFSQNFGSQNAQRLKQFLNITLFMASLVSLVSLIAISGYLTAIHLQFQSGMVSLCRSLIFPVSMLIILFMFFDYNRFVIALPIGECLTFIIALSFFIRHNPARAIAEDETKS
jgi:Na+-driven multidrug efflux pump